MSRFLSSVIIITMLSIGYVYQQVNLIEQSYRINFNSKRLSLLIDQNESLRYNVASLKSPGNLKQRLVSNSINLDTPQNWYSIRLAKQEPKLEKSETKNIGSFQIAAKALINIITPKTEAIAQEINQP